MSGKDSPQSVIDSYRKQQQMTRFYVWGLAALLVVVGIIILVVWFAGSGDKPKIGLFATDTPTPTNTITPTATVPTLTATITPTETLTPTVTMTATLAGPFEYEVKENDTCWDLAIAFEVDLEVLVAINSFEPGTCPITPGDRILIPLKDMVLPTTTPISITEMPKGTRVEYTVQSGDTLASIAAKFNSTMEAIMAIKENLLTDANTINLGQKLIIPVNIATATPTRAPTKTVTPNGTATVTSPSATPKP